MAKKVLKFSFTLLTMLCLGLVYGWSIFVVPLEAEFGWERSETSLTFSISMISMVIGIMLGGQFNKKKDNCLLYTSGATVGLAGMGLSGWPEEIACAIADNYLETGHPHGINLKQGSAMGDWKERGVTRLGHEGLISKWSGAHVGSAFSLCKLAVEEKLECHCLPPVSYTHLPYSYNTCTQFPH